MRKKIIFVTFVILVIISIPSYCFSFDNSNIKDPTSCNNLMTSILLGSDGGSIYKLSPIADPELNNAGRYDYIEVDQLKLSNKSYRKKIIKTEGRVFYKGAQSITDAQEFFHSWVKSPKVIFAIPDDMDSIKNIYGTSLNDKDIQMIKKQIDSVHNSLQGINTLQQPHNSNEINVKYINSLITSETNDTIILVGHNHKGLLKLPNGESIDITKTQKFANKHNKTLLIISCNSFDYVDQNFEGLISIERLNYEAIVEGLKLAEKNRCNFTECTMYMGDYVYYLDQGIALNVEKNKKQKIQVKLVLTISVGGTATCTFIVLYEGEN